MHKKIDFKKIIFVLALLIAGVFTVFWLSKAIGTPSAQDWQKSTSPLPRDAINDLCAKFDLAKEDPICTPNHAVFAPDFYPAIKKHFPEDASSFQDVQKLLESYLVYTEDMSGDSISSYFRAWYDLRGDGTTALIFYFDGDQQNSKLIGYVEFFWRPGQAKAGEQQVQ